MIRRPWPGILSRMVHSLFQYRRFIWQNAVADLRHRYAGTGLGVVWNVAHPLALIAVYSVVFSTLMHPPAPPGVNASLGYVLYLCSGLLPWLAFAECVTRGTSAFSDNAIYLKKLPIPEQIFVAQTAASATLGLGISFALLLILAIAVGHAPAGAWLLLPLPLIAFQAMGFAIGLLFGTLNAFLRDIGQILMVGLQVVMWTVPIVYWSAQLPPTLQALLRWHPLMPALSAIRDLFMYGRSPALVTWIALFAWPAVLLTFAGLVFSRLRRELRDVL